MSPAMASPDSLDPNDQPRERQPARFSRRDIALWLVVVSLLLFILPLRLISSTVRGDVQRMGQEIEPIKKTLTRISVPAPEVKELTDTLSNVRRLAGEIGRAYPTIASGRVEWPAVMSAIGNYDPTQLTLSSITQTDNLITLRGRAADSSIIADYVRSLRESNLFSGVVLQSVKAIATTPPPPGTPAPTGTRPPAGTPAPTPTGRPITVPPATPGLRDAYEIDDFQPKDIILGQPQTHNFYPVYDVDQVKFLAKAGRHYRVFTSDLTPGVDTLLTVLAGQTTHTNDDRRGGPPGDLSSEVIFQVRTGYDVEAVVTISNRGQYGPDKSYRIAVEEIIPTPTPTRTSTPTPPPTPTPSPTAIPANTPTSTPDLRDAFEPDDPNPKGIAIGETQTHNFYPDGDVDKVTFGAKAGRWYALSTSKLALGVDTKIEIALNENYRPEWTNDDIAPGSLESEVRFIPEIDGNIVVTITTAKSGQYGPDKTYNLTLSSSPTIADAYEPDDTIPKSIAIGETQPHNFYPDNDRDLVQFAAKAGHQYAIFTSDLALGVDTHIRAAMGGAVIGENDDFVPGAGYASGLCLSPVSDGTVVVTITNLQRQYGSNRTYKVAVSEAPIMWVSPLNLNFGTIVTSTPPRAQEVNITNIGGGTLTWRASKEAFWLNTSPSSGIAPSVMSVSIDASALRVGTYTAQIAITGTSFCTRNMTQTMLVNLQVVTPTLSLSSPSRPPGLAWLGPGLALADPSLPVAERARFILPPPAEGGRKSSAPAGPEAVEFVIVLELRKGTP